MKIDKGLIGGSTNLLILSLLKDQDMYGYEIIKELEDRSNNTFKLKEGTLYPILHRLENEGFLKSYRKKGDTGKERKYYQITRKGEKQLVEERRQWQVFSTSVNKVIGGEEHGFSKSSDFLDAVLSYIKFPLDRQDIRLELEDHILDKIDYYIDQGLAFKEAEEKAIEDMGNPKDIGMQLNKEHNPILGWLWVVSKGLVTLFIIVNVFMVGPLFFILSFFIFRPKPHQRYS